MNVPKKDLFGRAGARNKPSRNDLSSMTALNSANFAKNLLPFLPQTGNDTSGGSRPSTSYASSHSNTIESRLAGPSRGRGLHSDRNETSERSSTNTDQRHSNTDTHDVEEIMSQHQRRIESNILKKPRGQGQKNLSGTHTDSENGPTKNVLRVLSDTSPEYQFLKPVNNLTYRAPTNQDSTFDETAEQSVTPSSTRNKTTSSEKKTPKSQSIAPKTTSSSTGGGRTDNELSCCVVAVTEGRGHASGEVGIAAMDPRRPHLILCQISDSQRYTRTLTKLNVFNFIEAIVPNTFVEGPTPRKLYMDILDRFPSITVNHVQRRHFSEATGLQMIQQYCSQQSESVMVVLKDKFYALAAAAALLKYIEFTQSVLFAPYSLKVEFQGTEGTSIIDLDTANRLELVMGLVSRDERQSLLGVLKHCRTRGGVRLLRANLLQPFSDPNRINIRLNCVQELIDNPILFNALEVVISQMKSAESLLSLCMHPPQQSGLKAAQYQLKYALLLKTTLELVPALSAALENATSDYFQAVRENLTDRRLADVLKRIHLTIVEGTPGFRPGTFNQLHACFMICAGINGLLDIAKKTYCELAQEISDLVDGLKEKLQLPMRLGFSQGKGYHIVLSPLDQVPVDNLPSELILVQKSKSSIMCYTSELVALDQRCQQALHEIELMSNVLLFELLNDIRDKIACLFPLCECVAELDVCIALAHIGAADGYVRPNFGGELNLKAARHPILDVTSKERIVANDVFADTENNFVILTGPNQSGKSIYIRQIALLQVMAQVGSYVPAAAAQFRIADRIFSRIGFDDNIESNASTLMVELQDMKFIMGNLTKSSLIIVDELCRGTSVDEGTCLAFVLCEQLIDTSAFTFFTTHFLFLTKLQEMYYNVRNFHFETMLSGDGKPTLRYTHKMLKGITPAEQYGIQLAQLMGFSDSILESAKICATNLLRERKPQHNVHGLSARYEISQKMRINLPQSDDATWDQMLPVIRHYKEQYKMLLPEDPELQKLICENSVRQGEEILCDSESSAMSHDATDVPQSPLETSVVDRRLNGNYEVPQSPSQTSSPNVTDAPQSPLETPVVGRRPNVTSEVPQSPLATSSPNVSDVHQSLLATSSVGRRQNVTFEVPQSPLETPRRRNATSAVPQSQLATLSPNVSDVPQSPLETSLEGRRPIVTFEVPQSPLETPRRRNATSVVHQSPSQTSSPYATSQVPQSPLEAFLVGTPAMQLPLSTAESSPAQAQMNEDLIAEKESDSLDESGLVSSIVNKLSAEEIPEGISEMCEQAMAVGSQKIPETPEEPSIGKSVRESDGEVAKEQGSSTQMEPNAISELENSARTQEAALLLLNLHTTVTQTPAKRKWTPPFKQDCKKETTDTKKAKPAKEKPRIDELVRTLSNTLPDIVDKSPYYQWKYSKDKKGLKTVATATRSSPGTVVRRSSSAVTTRAGPSNAADLPAAVTEEETDKAQQIDISTKDRNVDVNVHTNKPDANFESSVEIK